MSDYKQTMASQSGTQQQPTSYADADRLSGSTGNGSSGLRYGESSAAAAHQPPVKDNVVTVEPPKQSDLQPKYQQTLPDDGGDHGWYGSMTNTLGSCVGGIGAIPMCICFPNPFKRVQQGNVGLVTKFGKLSRCVDPGLVRVNPLSEKLFQVDVKIQILEVGQQTSMTKDNVNVQLNSVIYYHIIAPHRAAFSVQNVRIALTERTQTTLRHVVGSRVLQDLIERREEVAASIQEIIDDVSGTWGVKVESILIKDLLFSRELQESLSMAAQAKRIGESKVISAKAEVESAKLMRQAADILSSKAAMQIRYLEAMQAMAKTSNSKVIFMPGNTSQASDNMMKNVNDEAFDDPQMRSVVDTSLAERM